MEKPVDNEMENGNPRVLRRGHGDGCIYIYINALYVYIYICIDSLGIFPNNGGCMGLCMVVSRLCSVRRCTGLGFTEIPQIMVECLAGFVHQPL